MKLSAHLLVNIQLAENLSRVQQVCVIDDLLDVPTQKRQIQDER
jgi:hypothetical protein